LAAGYSGSLFLRPTELRGLDNAVMMRRVVISTNETREATGELVLANRKAFYAAVPCTVPGMEPLPSLQRASEQLAKVAQID
jgi:hypothetical protein